MIVEAEELGNRPVVSTPARRFAPQALRSLAAVMSTEDWATKGFVRLDWSDVTNRLPDDAPYPVLYVQAVKDVDGRQLNVELRIDVDDVFGSDSMTPTILVDMLRDMQVYMDKEVRNGPPDAR